MSTTTNFKRIALVAVAALGMGVLNSVPSQAAPVGLSGSAITLSTTAGAPTLSKSDSTTAATVSASVLVTTAGESLTLSVTGRTKPALASAFPAVYFMLVDTVGSTSKTVVQTSGTLGGTAAEGVAGGRSAPGTLTETGTIASMMPAASSTNTYVSGKFFAIMESITTTRVAGTYTYTVLASMYLGNAISTTHATQTIDISFVVPVAATDSTTIVPGSSTAFIGTGTSAEADAVISALATASSTPAAYVRVRTYNTVAAAAESVTATISGAGILYFGGVGGASLTIAADGDDNIEVRPDGRAGVATITISTTTRNFPAKTMSFYAEAPKTLVASVSAPNAVVGTNSDVVRVTATDANGVNWTGALYIYASSAADAAVAGAVRASAVSCTAPTATQPQHVCPVTGIAAGTAKFKVSNYATAALATAAASGAEVTSNEVTVTVNANAIETVKLEFDKATYAPGERARIYVTPLDSAGKAVGANTYANLFATGGISTASALTFAGSTTTADSLTAVSITTKATSSSTSGARAGSMEYTVYMPVGGGTVTISATGGTTLPIAGRVAVTASATVTDSGAAALAAVNALATTVASLRTLITTLTNLVLKIQKKVKA